MLGKAKLTAFAATAHAARARTFYQKTLGLRLLTEDEFALAFDSGGVHLRIQKVEQHAPPPFTVLGWEVASIKRTMTSLAKAGNGFRSNRFSIPH